MSNLVNDNYISKLTSRLPSFYKDYVYDDEFIKVLFDSYVEVNNNFVQDADRLKRNTTLDSAELYKTIPMLILSLDKSLYNIVDVANTFKTKTNKDWFSATTTFKDKIDYLDNVGKYDILTVPDSPATEKVIQLSIQKDYTGILGNYVENEDYVLQDGKLYVFGELAKVPVDGVKKVVARNIMTDAKKLEDRWGILLPFVRQGVFSRHEYRDLLQALIAYQPYVKNLRDAVQAVTLSKNSFLVDRYSRKNVSKEFLTDDMSLGPFEFTYNIPANLVTALLYVPEDSPYYYETKERTEAIYDFINALRPAHTNFFLRGTLEHVSLYPSILDIFKLNTSTLWNDITWVRPGLPVYDNIIYDVGKYFATDIISRPSAQRIFNSKFKTKIFPDGDAIYDIAQYDADYTYAFPEYIKDPYIESIYHKAIYGQEGYRGRWHFAKSDSIGSKITFGRGVSFKESDVFFDEGVDSNEIKSKASLVSFMNLDASKDFVEKNTFAVPGACVYDYHLTHFEGMTYDTCPYEKSEITSVPKFELINLDEIPA